MIEISHLTKKYGTHVAVDDLNLTIEPGRIYGLLGPNGAGKSTTMNMLTGYLGATEGTIKINGFDILAQPEDAKKCIGYLPVSFGQIFNQYASHISNLCGCHGIFYIGFPFLLWKSGQYVITYLLFPMEN